MDDVVADLERYQAALDAAKSAAPPSTPGEQVETAFVDSIFTVPEVPKSERRGSRRDGPTRACRGQGRAAKSVLCVEAQTEIQDALRKTSASMGYRVMLVSDAERAAEMYRESPVDAVIFDTDGQGAESIEAFIDMHEKAHEGGSSTCRTRPARAQARSSQGETSP